jgi:hypothetical protein
LAVVGAWVGWEQPAQAGDSSGVQVAPANDGSLGAWLVAGPLTFQALQPAKDKSIPIVETPFQWGEKVADRSKSQWSTITSEATGRIELSKPLKVRGGPSNAALAGVLHVASDLDGYFLLSVNDEIRVFLDGNMIVEREKAHPYAQDNLVVPVKLKAGAHKVVILLHKRNGKEWLFRFRVTDHALAAAPGVRLELPGEQNTKQVAANLTHISLIPGLQPDGYAPRVRLEMRGGVPNKADRQVQIRWLADKQVLGTVSAGMIPLYDKGSVSSYEVRLPQVTGKDLAAIEEKKLLAIEVDVFGQTVRKEAHIDSALRIAMAKSKQAKTLLEKESGFVKDKEATLATLQLYEERLEKWLDEGDDDLPAQITEANDLLDFSKDILAKKDPILAIRGAKRIAYRSPGDGNPSQFGLYLPPDVDLSGKKHYPLIVAIHGMWGQPMQMMRWFFGRDDGNHLGPWEDRHPVELAKIQAIVVTPYAHYNSMYRDVGEDDVVQVMRWAKRMFPIDNDRVHITGPSMAGTGTAAIAFKFAEEFASAAPLCGYHNYYARTLYGKLHDWEKHQGFDRTTVMWAENGLHLPLYIVQGERDLPVENSEVLVDRYKNLGYRHLYEHPDEGHNVWQPTYENLKGYQWLTSFRRNSHPQQITFKTLNLRYNSYAWLKVKRLEQFLHWAEIRASIRHKKKNIIELKTKGALAVELERDPQLLDITQPIKVKVDRDELSFDPQEVLAFEKQDEHWKKGIHVRKGLQKLPGLSGPIRDVFHKPLLVVYGTQDPTLTRANREVARWFARVKTGFDINYSVIPDRELTDEMVKSHSIVLVGGSASNQWSQLLDKDLPIHLTKTGVQLGNRTFEGEQMGTAFVYPNPRSPSNYVVMLAGVSVRSTLRAMSLPELLPDYVVFDEGITPVAKQLVLNKGSVQAAGMFDEFWKIPPAKPDSKSHSRPK